jgi:membrane protease YdiL (CAAX protease family)
MPLPMIRFGLDTQWFASTFDFITGPIFQFTLAPKERIRLTGEMRMETYDLAHLDCEFALWYRLFSTEHKMGDFAGIGLGFKNGLVGFDLSRNINTEKTFELQYNSIFAAVDLSILKIEGWFSVLLHGLAIGTASVALLFTGLILGGQARVIGVRLEKFLSIGIIAEFFSVCVFVFSEELFCRGYIMTALKTTRNKWVILLSSPVIF